MICPFCKFDNAEASVFCLGCGGNLDKRPVPRPKAIQTVSAKSAARVALHLGIGFVMAATAGFAVLVWFLQSEQPHHAEAESIPVLSLPSGEEPSRPGSREPKKPANDGPVSRRARASMHSATDLESGTLENWTRSSYASRLTYSANYVTSRARIGSIEQIKDAAVQLESCISKVANEGISRTTRASKAAAHCLTKINN